MLKDKANNFNAAVGLPGDAVQAGKWQESNRSWWENNSMRYDWDEKIPYPEFSKEFYQEIDGRFFARVYDFFPWKEIPFDALIDFKSLADKDVLEIGVGNGSVAQLLAQRAGSFIGIDLTEYAIKSTKKRLELFSLGAQIEQMDAEQLKFPDNSFDFIWSWGVIHHSSNTKKILSEIKRVLRPDGKAVVMVYHRGWWNYYVVGTIFRGILKGGFLKYGSLHNVMQADTDGAIARYYSAKEWRNTLEKNFVVEDIFVCGPKTDLLPLPAGKIKNFLMRLIPNLLNRFLTRRFKCGSFLVSVFKK